MTTETLERLRDVLADAFGDLPAARELAERAGIPRQVQPIDQPNMRLWWWETAHVAWGLKQLVTLVEVAAGDPTAVAFAPAFAGLRDGAAGLQAQPAPRRAGRLLSAPIPPAPPALIGRAALLDALAAGLIAPGPPMALRGLPGAGKTALALALAGRDDVKAAFPAGRAWLPVGPTPVMLDLLGRLLEQFDIPAADLASEDARADRLRRELEDRRFLLILDDVWAAEHARPFLDAVNPLARALVTTRHARVAADLGADDREAPLLDEDSAVQILAAGGGRAAAAAAADEKGVLALAADLGYLPLALHVAARQLDRLSGSEGPKRAVQLLAADVARRLLDLRAAGRHTSVPGESDPRLGSILAASYDRLPGEPEKRAFRRLAVFGGQPVDFDAAAMAAVLEVDEGAARDLRLTLLDVGLLERSEQASEDAPRFELHQVLARYAAAQLAADPERAAAHARHAGHYLAAMEAANKAGRFYIMRPDLPQILAALGWAADAAEVETLFALLNASGALMDQFGATRARAAFTERGVEQMRPLDQDQALAAALEARASAYRDLAKIAGEDRHARLLQALADHEKALSLLPTGSPDYVGVLNNRANLYRDLADTRGEDRGTRLRQAIADFDAALPLRRDQPLLYAQLLNNRANAVSALANVEGEDRAALLREALRDYEAALPLRRAIPLQYAQALNNRGIVLQDLADMAGEDRSARLRQALRDFDEALSLREDVPLDYAETRFNRAQVHRMLASAPGEDYAGRLRLALADLDAALTLLPEGAVGYATVLSERAAVYSALAEVEGQDRGARLRAALADLTAALPLLIALPGEYAQTLNIRALILRSLAHMPGEDARERLLQALADHDAALPLRRATPPALAQTLNNRANIYSDLARLPDEDRALRLRQALEDYEQAAPLYRARPLSYAGLLNNLANIHSDLADEPGEDAGVHLRLALQYHNESLPLRRESPPDLAMTYANRAVVLLQLAHAPGEDPAVWLRHALSDIVQAGNIFSTYGLTNYLERVVQIVRTVRADILAASDAQTFAGWWGEITGGQPVPDWLG